MFREKQIHYTITGSFSGLFIGIMDVAEILFAKEMFFDTAEMMRAIFYTIFIDISFGTILLSILGLFAMVPSSLIKKRVFPNNLFWKSALFAAMLLGPILYFLLELTSGPRVSQLPGRYFVLMLSSVIGASLMGVIIVHLPAFIKRTPIRITIFTTSSTLLALSLHRIDTTVFVRLYPLFHLGLSIMIAVVLAGSVSIALHPVRRTTSQAALSLLVVVLIISGSATLVMTFGTQNIRFVINQQTAAASDILAIASPFFGKKLDTQSPSIEAEPQNISAPMLTTLPGSDLFLVTIDALRYDRLKKTGAKQSIMPHLDKLSDKSSVFTRGYSPIPHTSYAITSLLTGKYTRPLFDVPGAPEAHETWPEIMRRFRYETSAFFPPAVFFIDKARFLPYYRKGVGFLYKHVDSRVSAKEKVALLADHVTKKKKTGRPHFSWIHFFEPHEPYDENCTRFGESPEDRYNCELNKVDEALGDLFKFIEETSPKALLIVTADHGEAFGEHNDRYHGTSLYDEQIRVPIIIHAPGIPHRIINTPVSLVDLLGTALRILDIPIPARVRSRNLTGLLKEDQPLDAFSEVHNEAMVIYKDYKIICDVKSDLCRLYDLNKDPKETRSVAAQHPKLVSKMKHRLVSWMESHARHELRPVGTTGDKRTTQERWPKAIQKALSGDTTVIPDLADILSKYKEPKIRQKAAKLIYKMADQFPSSLITQKNESDHVVEAWITALRVKQKERLFEQRLYELSKVLPTDTDLSRHVLLTLLSAGDKRTIPKVMAIALSESAPIEDRRWAVQLLGRLKKGDITSSKLIPLINNYQLTLDVAKVLGKLKCSPAVLPLVTRLKRERFPERKAAIIDALSVIGDWRAVPTITDHLNTESPPQNILESLANLVRPSPYGRRLPSEKKNQETLFFHPIKRLDLKFHLKNPETIIIRTIAKKEAGTISVFCNGKNVDDVQVPIGISENRLQIAKCERSKGSVPYNISITKSHDTIAVNTAVILGYAVN